MKPRQTLVLLLALATSSVAARAGVITFASVLVEDLNASFSIGYNYNGVTGYNLTGGCQVSPPTPCAFSSLGTTDTTGLLTSAFDQFTLSGVGATASSTAMAFATASLANGSIGVSDSGSCQGPSCDAGGSAGSEASAFDTLHFNVAGALSTTVTDITVNFNVNGNMAFGGGPGSLTTVLGFGAAQEETQVEVGGQFGVSPVLVHNPGSGWVSQSLTGTTSNFEFSGVYAITGSAASLGIDELFSQTCGGGSTCTYGQTGVVSFTLPTNVSFTSDSGVFLTQPSTETPEPGSMSLILAAGAAGLAIIGRKYMRPRA
jgi:hypothetical protein